MFTFIFGFVSGYVFYKFKAPLLGLINRATAKTEEKINKTLK